MSSFYSLLPKNLLLVILTYGYIFLIILVSDKAPKIFHWSKKTSRKTLHMMIGVLPFILPFFNHRGFPLMVAAPFIPITFFACPYSPFQRLKAKLSILQDKTEIGHPLGLLFYSVSYTILTALFFQVPYVVAAGVLPMAYGDSTAALIGERYGKWRYKTFSNESKSVEGSVTIFGFSFLSVTLGLAFFSFFFPLTVFEIVSSAVLVAILATVVEAISPKGADNLSVPLSCAALMYLILRG